MAIVFKQSEFESLANPYNPLQGKLERVIDYFVRYFGEEYRAEITNRLKETQYIFSRRGEDSFRDTIKACFDNQVLKVLNVFGAELVNKGITIYRFLDTPLAISGLNKLEKWKKKIEWEEVPEAFNLIRNFTDLEIYEEQRLLDRLNDEEVARKLYAFLNQIDEIYTTGYKNRIDEILKIKYEKTIKPFENFTLGKTKDLLVDWRMDVIDRFLDMFSLRRTKENYAKVSDFSKDFVEMLIEENELHESSNYFTVVNKLFEVSGEKKNHDNFDDLSLTEQFAIKKNLLVRVKEAMPRRFISEYDDIMSNIYRGKNGYFKTLNYLNKNFSNENYLICKSAVQGYAIVTLFDNTEGMHYSRSDSQGKLFRVVFVPSADKLTDDVLVHEMCHSCQSQLIECNGKKSKIKVGVLVRTDDLKTNNSTFDDLTNLNEVVNEYFSTKICDELKKDNFMISASNEGFDCKYRRAFPFLKDFLDENEELLKKCAMSSDEKAFEKAFGMVNFIQLNNVIGKIFDFKPAKGKSFNKSVKEGALDDCKIAVKNIEKYIKEYQREISEENYL